MVEASCATAGAADMTGAIEQNKAPPKRRQAKLSPRYARTHIFMRNEPSSPTEAPPPGPKFQPRRLYKLSPPVQPLAPSGYRFSLKALHESHYFTTKSCETPQTGAEYRCKLRKRAASARSQ